MTATEIVDDLLEGSHFHRIRKKQRKEIEAAGLGDVEDFYLQSIARVEPGKLIDSPGALAAYTHTWPEFEHWLAYNFQNTTGNPTAQDRQDNYKFYNQTPEEWHRYNDGVVYYEGQEIRIPGIKGYFQWKVEWSLSQSSNWRCAVMVDIEWWDREAGRIWKSHWKQPVMYDYKKDRHAYTQNKEHWDAAHPDYFDTAPLDEKVKAKLVKNAQAFLAKLGKVAKIEKVRWNVPELFQESEAQDFMHSFSGHPSVEQANKAISGRNRIEIRIGLRPPVMAWTRSGRPTEQEFGEYVKWLNAKFPYIEHSELSLFKWLRLGYTVTNAWVEYQKDTGCKPINVTPNGCLHFPGGPKMQEAKKKGLSPKGFEQVGGDWGDPWIHGGDWFDKKTGEIVHFDGQSEDSAIDSGSTSVDAKLTQANYMAILKSATLEDANAWENVEDEIRTAITSTLESDLKFPVYRTTVEKDETIESDWANTIQVVKGQFTDPDETWAAMSPVQKMLELAAYQGWQEFDYQPSTYTKAELSAYLGIEL